MLHFSVYDEKLVGKTFKIFYASTTRPMDRQSDCVFDMFICLREYISVCIQADWRRCSQLACRQLLFFLVCCNLFVRMLEDDMGNYLFALHKCCDVFTYLVEMIVGHFGFVCNVRSACCNDCWFCVQRILHVNASTLCHWVMLTARRVSHSATWPRVHHWHLAGLSPFNRCMYTLPDSACWLPSILYRYKAQSTPSITLQHDDNNHRFMDIAQVSLH